MASGKSSDPILFLGKTNFRTSGLKFGIHKADRRYHTYIVGQTGTGKTSLLESLIVQDIEHGEGVAVLDPHGDLIARFLRQVPARRQADLINFNVPDPSCAYGFNPLESVPPHRRDLAASEMIEALKKIWEKTWGPRMENILRNSLLLLLDQPQATLADINKLFRDDSFLKQALTHCANPEVRGFWFQDYARWTTKQRAEYLQPVQNKLAAFLSNPTLYRVFTQPRSSLDIRSAIDSGKIVLVNLSKGLLGGDNSSVLGALLVSRIGLAALSRADQTEESRRDFYLYLDEFQNFTTLSMVNILSELRKYRLSLTIAHQYLDQLEPEIRDAILGNVGNLIAFRVGFNDARILEKVFSPVFDAGDLLNLPNHSIYVRLMINGVVSKPFSADTLPPKMFGLQTWMRRAGYLVRLVVQRFLRFQNGSRYI